MSGGCVVVFGREPVAGRVKTRLAGTLGGPAAARIYRVLLEHSLSAAAATGGRVVLSLAEPPSGAFTPRPSIEVETQTGGDLGGRLLEAFQRRFGEGEERVVVIGSDCPGVNVERLQDALAAVAGGAPVLAPAADGGYWLVAQRRPGVDLFSAVPWSSPRTMEATRRRLEGLGVPWLELEELRDIDTADDLEAALRDPATPPELANRLVSCLSSERDG